MTPKTRPVSWIKAALREFEMFPEGARSICLAALTIAAEGGKADVAKPMQGLGSGVFEIALPFRGDAFRVVYAVQLAEEIWVVHAFQKKSTQGIKTPQREIDLDKGPLEETEGDVAMKERKAGSGAGKRQCVPRSGASRTPMRNNSRPSSRPKSSRRSIGNT
jgi:phage-related protein